MMRERREREGISGVQRRIRATIRCKSFGLFGIPDEQLWRRAMSALRWGRGRWTRRRGWDRNRGGGEVEARWG